MTKSKKAKDYFLFTIRGEMYGEIERCIKAKAVLAAASLLMIYIEVIGALIEGELGGNTGRKEFNAFLKYFRSKGNINHYKNFKITFEQGPSGEIKIYDIYKIIRCGLIHEAFPKSSFILKLTKEERKYAGIDKKTENGKTILLVQINTLFNDFKDAVALVKKVKSLEKNIEKSLNSMTFTNK